jgi:hypothetical protein
MNRANTRHFESCNAALGGTWEWVPVASPLCKFRACIYENDLPSGKTESRTPIADALKQPAHPEGR